MPCIKQDTCHKIGIILDKDMLDFQYQDAIRQVCGDCTTKEITKATITLELDLEADNISEHIGRGLTLDGIKHAIERAIYSQIKPDVYIKDIDNVKVEVK